MKRLCRLIGLRVQVHENSSESPEVYLNGQLCINRDLQIFNYGHEVGVSEN